MYLITPAFRRISLILRRWTNRLSIMLGFFCYVEIVFQRIEGTKPNYMFPWGRYNETLALFGAIFLVIAYFTWERPKPVEPPSPSGR